MDDYARFQSKIAPADPETGCMNWIAGCRCKYGSFWMNGKNVPAHRYALEHHLGRPIAEGLVARHKCRSTKCVNPEHLEEGTYQDNMDDKNRDGTMPRGDKHHARLHPEKLARGDKNGNAVLTADKVQLIRILYASGHGITLRQLGAMFNISASSVSHIIRRKTWTNVQ